MKKYHELQAMPVEPEVILCHPNDYPKWENYFKTGIFA